MSTKKKAAGLSALKDLQTSDPTTEEEAPAPKKAVIRKRPAVKAKPAVKATPKPAPSPKVKQEKVAFSLHLPEEAHSKIREISFHERISMTQVVLEGVDLLFESRGLPPIARPNKEDK